MCSQWRLQLSSKPRLIISGIWSGFEFVQPAAAVASSSAAASSTAGYSSGYKGKRAEAGSPEFVITVNTTAPLWFYCAQAMHCQSGMVMAVNVNATVYRVSGNELTNSQTRLLKLIRLPQRRPQQTLFLHLLPRVVCKLKAQAQAHLLQVLRQQESRGLRTQVSTPLALRQCLWSHLWLSLAV